MIYGKFCHACPDGGTDAQIAAYLGEGWTKEEVASIRGIYDSNESEPLIPEEKDRGKLNEDEKIQWAQTIAAYKHKIARDHINELKDSTRHPASAFVKLYHIPGWDAVTRNNRINMVVFEFSQALTRRQKELAKQGINMSREEICNGYTVDGEKRDGQFSIFEEVYYKFYGTLRNAQARIQYFEKNYGKATKTELALIPYYSSGMYEKDKHTSQEMLKLLNNWGAICSFARMRIRDKEGIKLGNNMEYAASTTPDDFSADGLMEDEYVLDESVREAWMTHQGEVSAFSNLGAEVRRFLSNVPVKENNKTKVDDFGYPVYYDPITTHQHLAEKLRGCDYESTMWGIFRRHINLGATGDPILKDVGFALLEAAEVPPTPVMINGKQATREVPKKDENGRPVMKDGKPVLVQVGIVARQIPPRGMFTDTFYPKNHSIITQMLTDLHSNMVPFTAMVRGKDGSIRIIRLNRATDSETFAEFIAQIDGGVVIDSNSSIYNEDGTINWLNFVKWYDSVSEQLPRKAEKKDGEQNLVESTSVFDKLDVYEAGKKGTGFYGLRNDAKIAFIMESLQALGINLNKSDVRRIVNSNERVNLVKNLSKAAFYLKQFALGKNNVIDIIRKANAGQTLTDEEQTRLDEWQNPESEENAVTLMEMIDRKYGQGSSQPVAEAIEKICMTVDKVTGQRGIERRVLWYDRKGKACSRYSDMTPSYMGDLIDKIKMLVQRGDGVGLKDFLMEKWGHDEFFYDSKNKQFRNTWLRELWNSINSDGSINEKSFAASFGFFEFLGSDINDPVSFENFSEKQHAVAMLKNFVQSMDQTNGKSEYCEYPCFILGDAGKQRFFRAKHYDEEAILQGFRDTFEQELTRMDNVIALRGALEQQKVAQEDMPENYVKSEHVFSTLMFLNPDFTDPKYFRKITGLTKDSKLKINDTESITVTDEVLKNPQYREFLINKVKEAFKKDPSVLDEVVKEYMEDSLTSFKERLVEQGVIDKNKNGSHTDSSEMGLGMNADKLYGGDIDAMIKDFFWNTKFATIQQIQMFTVDTAFYKDVKDLQKRYKEIYAPGKGLSTQARDYKGKLYAQKDHEVAVYFKDIVSSSKDRDDLHQTLVNTYGKHSPIVDEYAHENGGKGSSITDGQGYRTLESYRAIMGMQGKWTREMEKVYDRIQTLRSLCKTENRDLTADEVQEIADSMIILQPLKPYMFTMEQVEVGVDPNDPNKKKVVLIPVQHKYAEVILIPELMPKGKLRTMAEWMAEKGVDLLASDACVKVGAYGTCNIAGITDESALTEALDKGVKHKLSFSDYRIQSGVPEHLNQDQLFGTQIRKLIYSGIQKTKGYDTYLRNILKKYDGKTPLRIKVPGAPTRDGMVELNGQEVINLYNCLITANMFSAYDDMASHSSTKQQLSDMLIQNGISTSNRTEDSLIGLGIIDKGRPGEGDFVLPIGDPTAEHDTVGAVLSVFKKGVNKQKIKGGSAVQMAPMGKVEDGGLREVCNEDHTNVLYEEIEVTWNFSYTDVHGNEVRPKFNEYCFADNSDGHSIGDLLPGKTKDGKWAIVEKDKSPEEWEEYQSFTYKLVNGTYEPCAHDEDGAVVIKPKIEVEFPGSLDMIAYRIPTERLYSAVNCKIKRFSHPALGGVLKVPASGTTKAGFDFDIDKLYFFMKNFSQQHFTKEQVSEIWKDIYGLKGKGERKHTDFPGLYEALKNAQEMDSFGQRALSAIASGPLGKGLGDVNEISEDADIERLYKYWNSPQAIIPGTDGKTVAEVYGTSWSEHFRKYVDEHQDKYSLPFDEYNLNKSPFENSKVSRDNMLLGLMRERLKDEETMKERYTPGGFVGLSKAARDMRVLFFEDIDEISDGTNVDLDAVDRISGEIKDKKNPRKDPEPAYDYSDPSTILIYNQQNQIAAKLIGIFANQNTHHVFCSALYKLQLTDPIAFGDHPAGLSDFLHHGNPEMAARIDTNMAELLAAAVDAVKDPVLNYLNLNIVTADSAAVLIRLGYSQQEVGLLFNQPIIKELCEEVANNGTSVEVAINKISRKYEGDQEERDLSWNDIKKNYDSAATTSQNLANNILAGRKLKKSGKHGYQGSLSFRESQLQVLALFNQVQGAASEMNTFVQATRFTAANSVGSTWGDIIAVLERTEKFAKAYQDQSDNVGSTEQVLTKEKADKEYGKKKSKLLILPRAPQNGEKISVINMDKSSLELSPEQYAAQNYNNPLGFEQCMLDMVRKITKHFGQYYPEFTPMYETMRNRLAEMTKYGVLDADTINSATRDMMVALLGTNVDSDFDGEATINNYDLLAYNITDTFVNKATGRWMTNREFYTNHFPKLLGNIMVSSAFNRLRNRSEFWRRVSCSKNVISIHGAGGMQSVTSNDIIAAWEEAVRDRSTIEVNGETYRVCDIAMGIYFHNFYRLGFNFHGTSTMHLTPTFLKLGLKVGYGNLDTYVNFVNKVIDGDLDISRDDMEKFVNFISMQFILNHLDNYKFVFTANGNSPVGKYLYKKSGISNSTTGGVPEFVLDYEDLRKNGIDNLLVLQEQSNETEIAFKPVIAVQVGQTKTYYMAQSGSDTKFNVTSSATPSMRYVKVEPQGVRGRSIRYYNSTMFNKEHGLNVLDPGVQFLEEVEKIFTISPGGLQELIKHMKGMGIKVHTLREMRIFMEQHPELFDSDSRDETERKNAAISKRLRKATVIWGHPGMGKTHFFKNGGDKEVIDFDTVYKSRINKELSLPEGPEARKQWRREHRAEYKQKLFDLFDEAIADAKRTGKKLLVSDMAILRERESDLDVITQMTEENFAQRSEQRNEPYDANKKLWKQDIDEAMANVSDKSKIIETNAYFSDLYNIEFLQTPSGEVYGFTHNGEIYIDETKLDPQVPIHEYTHIWDNVVMQFNPRLWERGKRLLKDSKNEVLRNLWNEIAESDAYGKKWLAQGKTQDEIDNLIMSEVHSRLTGQKGAELLEQIEKSRGGKGLIARLKRWLLDVFKHIGKTFGTWTDEALGELTLEDFINMPLRDFLDGVNPNNYLLKQNKVSKFDGINQAALSGQWTNETLDELDNVSKQIENGQLLPERFSQDEARTISGVLAQAEVLITAGSSRNVGKTSESDNEEKRQDEDVILDWASASGLMVNDWINEKNEPYDSLELALADMYQREKDVDGSESLIYYDYETESIIKARSMEHYGSVLELLDSIALFNAYFPSTAYDVLGFGYDNDGEFRAVLSQPLVNFNEDDIISDEEINEYMRGLGFTKDGVAWLSPDGRFKIYDLNPLNVIKTESGDVAVIDADFYLTEPKLGFETQPDEVQLLEDVSPESFSDANTGNYQPEFNADEITYEEESTPYDPANMFTDDEWGEIFEGLIEESPLMASAAKQGLFSKQELKEMFSEETETNQSILAEIRRGLDDGSIKPMTIDEDEEDIPLCM